jgi:hypothetical protein
MKTLKKTLLTLTFIAILVKMFVLRADVLAAENQPPIDSATAVKTGAKALKLKPGIHNKTKRRFILLGPFATTMSQCSSTIKIE